MIERLAMRLLIDIVASFLRDVGMSLLLIAKEFCGA